MFYYDVTIIEYARQLTYKETSGFLADSSGGPHQRSRSCIALGFWQQCQMATAGGTWQNKMLTLRARKQRREVWTQALQSLKGLFQ